MKRFTIILLVGLQAYAFAGRVPEVVVNVTALDISMENKCINNGQPGNLIEIVENRTSECIKKVFKSDLPCPRENHQHFCSYVKQSELRNCFKNYTVDILPCLSENELYLQKFILGAFDAGFDQFCGKDGLSNTQYLLDTYQGDGECLVYTVFKMLAYGRCFEEIQVFKHINQGSINFNKRDLCIDSDFLHKCTTQVLQTECHKDFSRATDLIFRPFLEECNGLSESKK